MPQFDTFSFLSQLSWFFYSFFLILFFLNYYLLPVISTILKVRNSTLFLKKITTATTVTFLNGFFSFHSFFSVFIGKPDIFLLWYHIDSCHFFEYFLLDNWICTLFFARFFNTVSTIVFFTRR